ncbi:hypothetical protein GCM10027514_10900 [Azotobacter armeniacus]
MKIAHPFDLVRHHQDALAQRVLPVGQRLVWQFCDWMQPMANMTASRGRLTRLSSTQAEKKA